MIRSQSSVLCTKKGGTDVTRNIDAIPGKNKSAKNKPKRKHVDLNSRMEFITPVMLQVY